MIVVIGLVIFLMLSLLSYRALKAQLMRREAERLLLALRSRLRNRFTEVPELMDRAGLLQHATEVYTGKTSLLIHEAIGKADDLYLKTRCGSWLLNRVETLIEPKNKRGRVSNFFDGKRFEKAIDLLSKDSIGFETGEQRMQVLYSNPTDDGFRNLLGRDDDYPPFGMSAEELLAFYPEQLNGANLALERVEESIEQLPQWLTNVGCELDRLGQQIQELVVASQKDGFFPLTNLQEKLLPSVINLIDECIRQGAIDPVAAYESPAQLAMRQIKDIRQITDRIERLRTHDFPRLESMGEFQQVDPMSYTWIDQEMITHSNALESVCNHAVLWPMAEHIDAFSRNLDETLEKARHCAELSRGRNQKFAGLIDDVEADYRKLRYRLAESTGLAEDKLFEDDWSNPERLIKSMRENHQSMREALAAGQVEVARSKEVAIHQTINEVRDRLEVVQRISRVGDEAMNHVETRHGMLVDKVNHYRELLGQLQTDFHPDVLSITGERFGDVPDEIEALLNRVDQSLPKIKEALTAGQFLTAGRLLEEAGAELRFGELKVEATEQLFDSVCETADRCEQRHADARFRHRSLESRIEDRRTRQVTVDRYHSLTERLEEVERQLTSSSAINPFQIHRELDDLFRSVEQLEDRVVVDWDWYELASVSIKGAARALRLDREKGAVDHFEQLKSKVDHWQKFLEKSHQDWQQAYQAGFAIELEVARDLASPPLSESVVEVIREACRSVSNLADWENAAGIQLDRSAGRDRFEQARSYLLAGNVQKATAQASLAVQESRSELSAATTREQFAAFEVAGRKRRQDMVAILPDSSAEVFEFGALTPKSMQVVQPLNAHHLRGFKALRSAMPDEGDDNILSFPEVDERDLVKQA